MVASVNLSLSSAMTASSAAGAEIVLSLKLTVAMSRTAWMSIHVAHKG